MSIPPLLIGALTLGLVSACNAQEPANGSDTDTTAAIAAAVNDNVYRTAEQMARDRHPQHRVRIWSLDQGLIGYDTGWRGPLASQLRRRT